MADQPPGVSGLDRPCGSCRRRAGDHTLDEWAVCLNTVGHVLEYEETPDDVSELMKKRFSGLEDYAIADTFVARAGLLDAETGTVGIKVPALLLVRDTANGAANRAEQAARG